MKNIYIFGLVFLLCLSSTYAFNVSRPYTSENVSTNVSIQWSNDSGNNVNNFVIYLLNNDSSINKTILNTTHVFNGTYYYINESRSIVTDFANSIPYKLVANISLNRSVDSLTGQIYQNVFGDSSKLKLIYHFNNGGSYDSGDIVSISNTLAVVDWSYNNSLFNESVSYLELWGKNSGADTAYFPNVVVYLDTSNNFYLWQSQLDNLSIGTYYINVTAFNSTSKVISNKSGLFNINYNSLLNISAQDYLSNPIQSFNFNITDLVTNLSRSFSTSNYNVAVDILRSRVYQLFFNTSNYALTFINVTETSAYNSLTQTLYPSNSLFFTIRDSSGNIIYSPSTTISIQGTSGSYSASGSGMINLINLLPGSYTIFVNNANYSQTQLSLNVSGGTQLIDTYLFKNTTNILFNCYDSGGNALNNVLFQAFAYVNGSLVLVDSKLSELGKVSFNALPNSYYLFNFSKSGFATSILEITSLTYTSYDIRLSPDTSASIVPTAFVTFKPSSFLNGQNGVFSIEFVSNHNSFTYYNYSLITPLATSYISGTKGSGESFSNAFSIPSGINSNNITLNYYYRLSNGQNVSFTQTFKSVASWSSKTLVGSSSNTYGMLVGDRVIWLTIGLIGFMGVLFMGGSLTIALIGGGIVLWLFVQDGFLGVDGTGAFKLTIFLIIVYFLLRAWYNR